MKYLVALVLLSGLAYSQTQVSILTGTVTRGTGVSSDLRPMVTNSGNDFDTLTLITQLGTTIDTGSVRYYVESYILGRYSDTLLVDTLTRRGGIALGYTEATLTTSGMTPTLPSSAVVLTVDSLKNRWFLGSGLNPATRDSLAINAIKNRTDWKFRVSAYGATYNSLNPGRTTGLGIRIDQIKW